MYQNNPNPYNYYQPNPQQMQQMQPIQKEKEGAAVDTAGNAAGKPRGACRCQPGVGGRTGIRATAPVVRTHPRLAAFAADRRRHC